MSMNQDNMVNLSGTVHQAPWTSYNREQRGRVNFWLAVSRDLAGDGFELFQCAIEPKTAEELLRLQRELKEGRSVHLLAQARSSVRSDCSLLAQPPVVVFIAEECGLDGTPPRNPHGLGHPRRSHAHGKMAAAGDLELLPTAEYATS